MQLEIKLIGLTSSELRFQEHICNYLKIKYCLAYFSKHARGYGGALQAPQWGLGQSPGSQNILRFYIASNPTKMVKNSIWLINLYL